MHVDGLPGQRQDAAPVHGAIAGHNGTPINERLPWRFALAVA